MLLNGQIWQQSAQNRDKRNSTHVRTYTWQVKLSVFQNSILPFSTASDGDQPHLDVEIKAKMQTWVAGRIKSEKVLRSKQREKNYLLRAWCRRDAAWAASLSQESAILLWLMATQPYRNTFLWSINLITFSPTTQSCRFNSFTRIQSCSNSSAYTNPNSSSLSLKISPPAGVSWLSRPKRGGYITQ